MNCEQVDELLGAYALDAVDEQERAEIEAHLAGCGRHREVAALRTVALSLAATVAEREPPAALEARLLESLRGSERASRDAASTVPVARGASSASQTGRTRSMRLRWPAALAAAVLVATVAVSGTLMLSDSGETPTLVHFYQVGSAWMRAESSGDDAAVTVTMAGLERRPDSEAYQLWAVRDGAWLSVGVCNTDEESWWKGDFPFELQPHDQLVLTIEPAGGSSRPTSEPVMGGAGDGED